MSDFVPLDIAGQWPKLNAQLIDLVDLIPDDKLDWSPKPELFNFRGILMHIPAARLNWMAGFVKDGGPRPNTPDALGEFLRRGQTKAGIQDALRESWERVERFLGDRAKLDATHRWDDPALPDEHNGHWVAFHLLEHDIHHRADLFHYFALLGIEHPSVETP